VPCLVMLMTGEWPADSVIWRQIISKSSIGDGELRFIETVGIIGLGWREAPAYKRK